MSSSENTHKRRCIIKKLDFENCIVTNIKTKTRRKRKLRARVTQDFDNVHYDRDEEPLCSSPVFSQKSQSERSPVLMKNQRKEAKSPVLLKKKTFFKDSQESSAVGETVSIPVSPVFKLGSFKFTQHQNSVSQEALDVNLSFEVKTDSNSERFHSSEKATSTEDSKLNIEISSVDSNEVKRNESCGSSQDIDWESTVNSSQKSSENNSDLALCCSLQSKQYVNSEPIKKTYKKNSILARLQRALKKQASEKLLWQHRKQETTVHNAQKLSVNDVWNFDRKFVLKCRTLEPKQEINFLLVDGEWDPKVQTINKGSVLRLYPPWRKLQVGKSAMTVVLNVICLEILDEINESISNSISYDSLPLESIESDQKIFIDSLLSSNTSKFLY